MISTVNNIEKWQLSMHTLSDSATFLFNNKIMSDVTFVFNSDATKDSPASETKIYAHSWLLSMLSPVFYETFKDNFAVSKQIPISDTSYNCFLECLRFIYTNQCMLRPDNVLEIKRLSTKYSLLYLEEISIDYILKTLPFNSICPMLDQAITEGQIALKDKIIDFIAPIIQLILQCSSFPTIKKESLEAILNIEKIGPVTEVEIFEGVMKWAGEQCISTQIEANGSNKRLQLGELFKKIRFPTMSCEEFGKCIAKEEGLFTVEESRALFLSIAKAKDNKLGFPADMRNYFIDLNMTIERCMMANEGLVDPFARYHIMNMRSKFNVNKMIYITGVGFARSSVNQNVTIKFYDVQNALLYEQTFRILGDISDKSKLTKPLLIHPKQQYTIDIQFEDKSCRFERVHPVLLPWSTIQGTVQFNFSELSDFLGFIYFNL